MVVLQSWLKSCKGAIQMNWADFNDTSRAIIFELKPENLWPCALYCFPTTEKTKTSVQEPQAEEKEIKTKEKKKPKEERKKPYCPLLLKRTRCDQDHIYDTSKVFLSREGEVDWKDSWEWWECGGCTCLKLWPAASQVFAKVVLTSTSLRPSHRKSPNKILI